MKLARRVYVELYKGYITNAFLITFFNIQSIHFLNGVISEYVCFIRFFLVLLYYEVLNLCLAYVNFQSVWMILLIRTIYVFHFGDC